MVPQRLASYLALSLPVIFIVGLAIVISANPWFSFTNNALSDMGSLKNPNRWLFNSFLMFFALIAMFPSLVAFRNGLSYLMPFAIAFLFLVGIFPEELPFHAPSAVLFYILALADIAIVGAKLGRTNPINYLWTVLSVLVFLVILYLIKARVFKGLAIPELIGAAFILAWFVYLGILLKGFKP
ncbi:DUF998 domain-containing protein [Thermococcus piezophilus]|uniref:DUF998 domain-containing protein n=1 Tax=Thermococcus piezophilus TaxID=1712654 RepID=A0A172WEM6_9EURY|nr:DUF998 domain-containing protein [Thermococcus piezophilus]ANF21873.1 hypothetical protein A7C91_00620 [Thermococcus piezophilus]